MRDCGRGLVQLILREREFRRLYIYIEDVAWIDMFDFLHFQIMKMINYGYISRENSNTMLTHVMGIQGTAPTRHARPPVFPRSLGT